LMWLNCEFEYYFVLISLEPRGTDVLCGSHKVLASLYPPSERSELARYTVMLWFPSVCHHRVHSVFRCKYLDNGLS